MNKNFWKGKKVLITGFEGFLGSHLSRSLLKVKTRIIGLDIKVLRRQTIFSRQDYESIKIYKASVTNYTLLKEILHRHSVDIVFHLAAEAIVGRSYQNPQRAFHTNIQGTWSVLEACRQYGKTEAIIVASSDKAYGEHKRLPYKEDYPLLANHPYDVSKSCADLISRAYAHTYGLPVVITRCGNIYGPGDFNFSRLVPDAMRCLFYGKELFIRSDGRFVRDYVYIDDVVDGYIKAAELLRKGNFSGEVFNFSDEKPMAVLTLLTKLNNLRLTKKKLSYNILDIARYEIKKQYLDPAKAKRILRWRPRYNIEEGLRKTADWYFNYFCRQ
ncbi:MAG: GDP-mannose 4,6-dehydratase [Candidatus Omnitrophica bacterium]|nr:GDP-mannose 4,6-dehydratase [Candidatus Omnitrophota bacterium]